MAAINIGLSDKQCQGVVDILNKCLADTYLLLIKMKKYHWDVVGPQFRTLHALWEEHYEALTVSTDEIAERARALGGYPLGTAAEFLNRASIQEHAGDLPSASEMVARLVRDHEQVIRNLREAIEQTEEEYRDKGTADFLTSLMQQHEEMAWMLRSFIEGEALQPSGDRNTSLKAPTKV
ncbi:MAG: Dps family protein [Cyanobacteria bacterium P01_H01_bin.153]